MNITCLDCAHFINDPRAIELAFPGLNSLSSAYASVRAEAGICGCRDLFLSPRESCRDFKHVEEFLIEKNEK